MLHDFKNINPSFQVYGLDISGYAIDHSMDDIRQIVSKDVHRNYHIQIMNLIW